MFGDFFGKVWGGLGRLGGSGFFWGGWLVRFGFLFWKHLGPNGSGYAANLPTSGPQDSRGYGVALFPPLSNTRGPCSLPTPWTFADAFAVVYMVIMCHFFYFTGIVTCFFGQERGVW